MKATAFITEMKSMQYNVSGAKELLDMEILKDSLQEVFPASYDISFDNVTFSYTGQKKDVVLHNLNFKIPENSFTALVGPSGGGKSTIAKLIARFWDTTNGAIYIGDTNIKNIPLKQLSNFVSFVTQDNFLFNCSLMRQLLYWTKPPLLLILKTKNKSKNLSLP